MSIKRPPRGLIHHSDRGCQYCSYDYLKLLERFDMKASMSRKGNCYDNAPMESFWGTMKNELINHRRYATREEAIAETLPNTSRSSITGRDARPALATYPRRLMSGSSMPGGQRHEGHFASTIDIGGQVATPAPSPVPRIPFWECLSRPVSGLRKFVTEIPLVIE